MASERTKKGQFKKGTSGNPDGRPEHVPDEKSRKTVQIMVAGGIPQDQIAMCIGISKPTLEKHYRTELDTGAVMANAQVAASLYQMATAGQNFQAAKFWAQCRMGWKVPIEVSVPDLTDAVRIAENFLGELSLADGDDSDTGS